MLSTRSVYTVKLSTYSLSSLFIFFHLRRPADLVPCCYHLSLLQKPLGGPDRFKNRESSAVNQKILLLICENR
ncbi:hypothetical protein AMTRI_Chr10g228010 [Amborella trichopoda]